MPRRKKWQNFVGDLAYFSHKIFPLFQWQRTRYPSNEYFFANEIYKLLKFSPDIFWASIRPHEHTDFLWFSTDRLLVMRGQELKHVPDQNQICHDLADCPFRFEWYSMIWHNFKLYMPFIKISSRHFLPRNLTRQNQVLRVSIMLWEP